jgi:hypothetical protein
VDDDGAARAAGSAAIRAELATAWMVMVGNGGGSAVVSTVRPSGGAGARDFAALGRRTYGGEE